MKKPIISGNGRVAHDPLPTSPILKTKNGGGEFVKPILKNDYREGEIALSMIKTTNGKMVL